jgi:hypothetical protein
VSSYFLQSRLIALPFSILSHRQDIAIHHAQDDMSIIKLAILTGIEPIANCYARSTDSQIAAVSKTWDGDTLLHLLARNQYFHD